MMIGLAASAATFSQQMPAYGLERDMPVFLDKLKEELTYPLAWGNSPIKEFKEWKVAAKQAVVEAMMAPPPRVTDYKTEIVSEEQRNGYRARKIRFNLTGYSRVTAYMLVPDGKGPFPAVVLLHDHGGHYSIGKEKMIRPFAVESAVLEDADGWAKQCYGGQYVGDYLASQGYVVISIDAIFWGERGRKEGSVGEKYADVAGNFMMLGRSLSAFMNFEDVYTVDFLASQPEVDAARIGCMGFSMGGYRAWMLSALSDKINAGAAICWMNTTDCQFSWKYGQERGGFANMLPGIRRYLDYPHIASIACPKPMFFLNGKSDKLFPQEGVNDAFAIMRKVWDSQQAGDKLRTELWDMPHDCGMKVQSAVLEFFDGCLK